MSIKTYVWAGAALFALLTASLIVEMVKVGYAPAFGQAAQPVVPVVSGAVVSTTNPLPVTGSITVTSPLATNSTIFIGGNPVTVANPFFSSPVVAGAVVSTVNPLPVNANVFTNNVAVSPSNPLAISGTISIATYLAAKTGQLNAVTGDLLCVTGSASKVVRVRMLSVSAISSADAVIDVSVVVRSSLDTGGTPTVLANVPSDSTNAAATAVVTTYGTAPVVGTLVGAIRAQKLGVGKTTGGSTLPAQFGFGNWYDQSVVLRGATQAVCLTTTALAGGSYAIAAEWTEE